MASSPLPNVKFVHPLGIVLAPPGRKLFDPGVRIRMVSGVHSLIVHIRITIAAQRETFPWPMSKSQRAVRFFGSKKSTHSFGNVGFKL